MSNQWREDTFTIVQVIQRDMENGVRYADVVIADGAQNHPIIEKDGQLYWEPIPGMTNLTSLNLIDKEVLYFLIAEQATDELKPIIRDLGWSLEEYTEIFHKKEEQNDE